MNLGAWNCRQNNSVNLLKLFQEKLIYRKEKKTTSDKAPFAEMADASQPAISLESGHASSKDLIMQPRQKSETASAMSYPPVGHDGEEVISPRGVEYINWENLPTVEGAPLRSVDPVRLNLSNTTASLLSGTNSTADFGLPVRCVDKETSFLDDLKFNNKVCFSDSLISKKNSDGSNPETHGHLSFTIRPARIRSKICYFVETKLKIGPLKEHTTAYIMPNLHTVYQSRIENETGQTITHDQIGARVIVQSTNTEAFSIATTPVLTDGMTLPIVGK